MTPAEREALPPLDVTREERSAIENMRPHAPRNTLLALERLACRERQLLAKMALISTLELTLSNATRVEKKLVERIATLESVNRSLLLNRRNK